MKEIEIRVDQQKLVELAGATSCQELGQDKVRRTVHVNGKEYVTTGFCSSHAEGYIYVSANEVIDLALYKGKLKPLFCNERHIEIQLGKRPRGYAGAKARCGKRTLVLLGPEITFRPSGQKQEQLSIF